MNANSEIAIVGGAAALSVRLPVALSAPSVAVIVVDPVPTTWTTPFRTVATVGSLDVKLK